MFVHYHFEVSQMLTLYFKKYWMRWHCYS